MIDARTLIEEWRALYRRAINVANGLTNYVEYRPELRDAERSLEKIEADARALDAAPAPAPAPLIPEGWQLVPKEATEAMLHDGHMQIDFDRSDQNTYELEHESQTKDCGTTIRQDMREAWTAMLAAAPQRGIGGER